MGEKKRGIFLKSKRKVGQWAKKKKKKTNLRFGLDKKKKIKFISKEASTIYELVGLLFLLL